jgi:hypothetical protein
VEVTYINFREPFCLYVVEACGRNDREAKKKYIGLRIAEGPKPRVLFLAGCVPQSKIYKFAIHLHTSCKVVEYGLIFFFFFDEVSWGVVLKIRQEGKYLQERSQQGIDFLCRKSKVMFYLQHHHPQRHT